MRITLMCGARYAIPINPKRFYLFLVQDLLSLLIFVQQVLLEKLIKRQFAFIVILSENIR
jgi:hypothetical protein